MITSDAEVRTGVQRPVRADGWLEPIKALPAGTWLALAAGVALRLWFAGTSGLYLDEAQVLGIVSEHGPRTLFPFLRNHEAHPPAYYLVLQAWQAWFGSSNGTAIALSLSAGVALIPLVSIFVHRLTARPQDAVTAAWLVALSPTAVRYAGMVRPYALLSILVVVGFWCLLRFLRDGSWRAGLGYAVCATLMVYTHNWSWLVLAASGILGLTWLVVHAGKRTAVIQLVGMHILTGLLFLPWLPSFLTQVTGAGHSWPKPLLPGLIEVVWVLTGLPAAQAFLFGAILAVMAGMRHRSGRVTSSSDVFLVAGSAGLILLTTALALLLSGVTPLLISQCYAMFTPLLMAATAVAINAGGFRRVLSRAVLAACLVAFGARLALMSGWVRSDVREIGAFLTARVTPEDVVLVYPDYPAPTLARYFSPPGDAFTVSEPGLVAAIPFDHRIARDGDSTFLVATGAVIAREALEHPRVWYVTIENPPDYPPLRRRVEAELRGQFGPPTCVFSGNARPRLYEDMVVWLYESTRDSTPLTTPLDCR